jgi:ribose transport system substrate-binding protein
MRRAVRSLGVTAAAAALMLAAACGSSGSSGGSGSTASGSGDKINVDVGIAQLSLEGPPRIAYVIGGGRSYPYENGLIKGVEEQAATYGWKVDIFEGGYDVGTHLNQLQNAANSGKYNVLLIGPVGPQDCLPMQNAVKNNGVLVLNTNSPMCDAGQTAGSNPLAPGVATYVGGNGTYGGYSSYLKKVLPMVQGAQTAVYIGGPAGNPSKLTLDNALTDTVKDFPNITVADTIETDWTTPDTFKKMQDYLQGHPQTSLVIAASGDLSQGAVKAQETLGRKLTILDASGGSSANVELIKSGSVLAEYAAIPYTSGQATIAEVKSIFDGNKPAGFLNEADMDLGKQFPYLDAKNVASFTPQY